MPHDHATLEDAPRSPRRESGLREAVAELMVRAQSVPRISDCAMRAELEKLVAGAHDPAAALWDAYSGGRAARGRTAARHSRENLFESELYQNCCRADRPSHAALTLG